MKCTVKTSRSNYPIKVSLPERKHDPNICKGPYFSFRRRYQLIFILRNKQQRKHPHKVQNVHHYLEDVLSIPSITITILHQGHVQNYTRDTIICLSTFKECIMTTIYCWVPAQFFFFLSAPSNIRPKFKMK